VISPIIAILAAGILLGAGLYLAFRKFANVAAIRILRRKLWAHVLGLYLFGDDPLLAIKSLGQLAKTNLLLLLHVMPPLLVIAPFAALAIVYLNGFFTRTPLESGGPAVVTVRLRQPADKSPAVQLEAPSWITVDSPPVHVAAENEISWRIRATAAAHGQLRFTCAKVTVTKEVDSRPAPRYNPAEERLPTGPIRSISISQSSADIDFAGLTMHWISWLAAVSFTTAWMLTFVWRP
jgi:hypothetical protein